MDGKSKTKMWWIKEKNTEYQEQWADKNKASIKCVICKHSVSFPERVQLGTTFSETKHSDFNQKYSEGI